MNLDWDYNNRELQVSMLDYVTEALERFKRASLRQSQHQLHPRVLPKYGTKFQYATDADSLSFLGKEGKNFIQEVTGTFL